MVKIQKILVNIDLTTSAVKAVEWGKTLASLSNAELILFYDMEEVKSVGDYANLFAFPVEVDLEEKTKEKVKKALERYLKDFEGKFKYEFFCCGKDNLSKYIQENNVDLAILSEKYMSAVSKISCPVLITK
ncbi:universal stress protein [Hydrogenivirga sp. 128-5-R1-1]|uniref:universal stress protein n=1 Tax=Hydrogenivirga sp. 128-5-R1-1 TaxID=392423 RepID=UPI00015EEF17|nr:universal stress protein [Hydrogenivirga sp. 128-5-R1-1]EDP74235.1 hypothetical protein HG1285_01318 [Hydrogenivirga sp. 128-5-R1-1]